MAGGRHAALPPASLASLGRAMGGSMSPLRSSLLVALCLHGGLAQAASSTPALRLPGSVAPIRYTVELTVDPTAAQLTGVIDIDVEIARPIETLWLNATELTVRAAAIGPFPARVVSGGKDFIGLVIDQAITPGKRRVHLEYAAPTSTVDLG